MVWVQRAAVVFRWTELVSEVVLVVVMVVVDVDREKYLLAGSRDLRPRDWATGSKGVFSSDVEVEAEVKDDDGSSSARSLVATAVEEA